MWLIMNEKEGRLKPSGHPCSASTSRTPSVHSRLDHLANVDIFHAIKSSLHVMSGLNVLKTSLSMIQRFSVIMILDPVN